MMTSRPKRIVEKPGPRPKLATAQLFLPASRFFYARMTASSTLVAVQARNKFNKLVRKTLPGGSVQQSIRGMYYKTSRACKYARISLS